jgi:hypothetical protein
MDSLELVGNKAFVSDREDDGVLPNDGLAITRLAGFRVPRSGSLLIPAAGAEAASEEHE